VSKAKFFKVVEAKGMNSKWMIDGAPHGRRERYYYKTRTDAKAAAADKNAEIAANGNDSLPVGLRLQAIDCAKRLSEFDKTLVDATEFFLEYLRKATSSVQVSQFCQIITAEFERRLEAEEIGKLHNDMMRQTLARFGSVFGDRPVKTVTGAEIKDWLAGLELGTKTRNKLFRYIKTASIVGVEKGLLDHEFNGVKKFTENKKLARGAKPLTVQESIDLINASSEEIRPMVLLGMFAGIRFEERTKLDWADVKPDHVWISAAISKTGKDRMARIEPNLASWLELYRKESGPIAITGRDGKYSKTATQNAYGKALKDSKIEDYQQGALRDSFCSYGTKAFGSAITAESAGHTEKMLKDKYQKPISPEEAAKFWSIRPDKDGKAVIEHR
jgi:integrase